MVVAAVLWDSFLRSWLEVRIGRGNRSLSPASPPSSLRRRASQEQPFGLLLPDRASPPAFLASQQVAYLCVEPPSRVSSELSTSHSSCLLHTYA